MTHRFKQPHAGAGRRVSGRGELVKARVGLVLMLLAGCASAALSQEAAAPQVEAGPGPYEFDLDAQAGSFAERFMEAPAGAFTVTGVIQFAAVKSSARWAPMASVEVMGPKGKDTFHVGLVAYVPPAAPASIQVGVRDALSGLPDADFARVTSTTHSIAFEVRLDRSDAVQVSVAGRTGRVVPVRGAAVTRIRVGASSGHIRFANIRIAPSDR